MYLSNGKEWRINEGNGIKLSNLIWMFSNKGMKGK